MDRKYKKRDLTGGDNGMLRKKSCPRCEGPVGIDRDEYGWYEQCIMCGYQHDLESVVETQKHSSTHKPDKKETAGIPG
jgi:hypothetical protein